MKHFRKALCLLLTTLLVFALALPVAADSEDEFTITVGAILEGTGDSKTILLEIENNTGYKMSFGWVNTCELLVTTDEGTFSKEIDSHSIPQGDSSYEVFMSDCPGEVEKIKLTDLRQLDERGLPELEVRDLVLYNAAIGKTSYSGAFEEEASFGFSPWFIVIPLVVFGVIISIVIVAVQKYTKRNRSVTQPFTPFAGAIPPDDMGRRMHEQAHQQAVNNVNQQQFNDFMHQSANTTDMGGFNPPPPPPPPMGM